MFPGVISEMVRTGVTDEDKKPHLVSNNEEVPHLSGERPGEYHSRGPDYCFPTSTSNGEENRKRASQEQDTSHARTPRPPHRYQQH